VNAVRASLICDRVREQVSLQLDGELSELERRMLDAHLQRCASCEAFAARLDLVTTALREAPLEPLHRRIVVSAPRRISVARVQVAIAAVFALAALGLGAQLSSSDSGLLSRSKTTITRYPAGAEVEAELALFEKLSDRERPVSAGGLVL
jgi:predicted anti-sigma-YlaC factor YlaD